MFITTALRMNAGATGDQHPGGEAQGEDDVELGEEPDALVDAGRGGHGGHHDGEHHQRDLRREPDRHPEEDVEALVEEDHADAEAGRHAEDGAEHGGGVHGMAERSVDPAAEDRVERGSNGEREVGAVGEVAQRHPHQGVEPPAGDAVVEERPDRGLARRLDGLGIADRRREVLADRLGDGVEHHVGADAGGEQHRGPGERRELRLGVVGTQLDRPVAGQREIEHEDQHRGGQHDVEPAEPVDDVADRLPDDRLGLLGGEDGPERHRQDADHRGREHGGPHSGATGEEAGPPGIRLLLGCCGRVDGRAHGTSWRDVHHIMARSGW